MVGLGIRRPLFIFAFLLGIPTALFAFPEASPPKDCYSCHGGGGSLNDLLQFEETSLEPDTIYAIDLNVPAPDRAGIDVYTIEITDGSGLPVGEFVRGIDDDTLVLGNPNRITSNGFYGEIYSDFQGDKTFFWKTPATLNEGVRIVAEVVDSNGNNSTSGDRVGKDEVIVGELIVPDNPFPSGSSEPPPFFDFDPNSVPDPDPTAESEVFDPSAPQNEAEAESSTSSGGGCGLIRFTGHAFPWLPLGLVSLLFILLWRRRSTLESIRTE